MLGFGFTEIAMVVLLVLLLFGPQEIPKLARFISRLIYQFKDIFSRLEKQWNLNTEDKKMNQDE